jgi:predicted ATPase
MRSVGAPAGQVFVGRQPEMAVLQTALREASAAHRRLVLVGREPGIGKTRAAAEFGTTARRPEHPVAWRT